MLRALGLGDLLAGVPALRGVRRGLPGHELVLLGPAALAPLLREAGDDGGPLVDRVVDHAGLGPVPAELHGADVAVNLHGRGPQSHELLLAAAPGRLVAFGVPGLHDGPAWRADEHERERWCRLVRSAGWDARPDDLRLPAPPLPAGLARHAGALVLHPGAASEARRWPVERFAAVAADRVAAGEQVVVTGGAAERERGLELAAQAGLGPEAVLAGRTDVVALAGLLAHAGALLSGDTGVAHLAVALGTPSVTLFGPVDPALWGPPAGDPRHVALWAGPRPDSGDPHADRVDPALLALDVGRVRAALAALSAA